MSAVSEWGRAFGAAVLGLALVACSPEDDAPAVAEAAPARVCEFPDAPAHTAPDWVCAGPPARSAVGSAPPSKAGLAFSRAMALADARTRLARQLGGDSGGPAGFSVDLERSRVLESVISPAGRVYVLVAVD